MSKAQFSVEFILLFAMLMFIFLLLLVAADKFMGANADAEEQHKLDSVGEIIKKELLLAKQSPTEFESKIKLPLNVDGTSYTIEFDGQETMIISHATLDLSVIKEIPKTNIMTSLSAGNCYLVKKDSTGELSIDDPIPPTC